MGGQKKSGTEPDTFLLHTFRQIGTSRQEKEKEQGETQNGISTPHRQEGRAKKRRNAGRRPFQTDIFVRRGKRVSAAHRRSRFCRHSVSAQIYQQPSTTTFSPAPKKKTARTPQHAVIRTVVFVRRVRAGPVIPLKNQRPALASSTFSRSAAPSLMRFSLSRYAVLLTRG